MYSAGWNLAPKKGLGEAQTADMPRGLAGCATPANAFVGAKTAGHALVCAFLGRLARPCGRAAA